jgi:hypothetical protein
MCIRVACSQFADSLQGSLLMYESRARHKLGVSLDPGSDVAAVIVIHTALGQPVSALLRHVAVHLYSNSCDLAEECRIIVQVAAALAVSALYLAYQRLTLPYVERLDQVGENISDFAAVGTFFIFLVLVLMPNASVTTTCVQL